MKSIVVFCAHPDDEVFGTGGAIAKYSEDGYKIYVVIFSYGEQSHPWMKHHVTIETRVKESKAAGEILGCEENIFFGLKEGKFPDGIKEKNLGKVIKKIITERKPEKIFTHSSDDPHPDHKEVHKAVMSVVGKMSKKYEVYCFEIWNPVNLAKRDLPRLYVPISLGKKLKALRCFHSQLLTMITLLWTVYLRAIKSGLESGYRFAEVFYKVR
jgi:LmbE family N-acetylglucosaminyl deacetylase